MSLVYDKCAKDANGYGFPDATGPGAASVRVTVGTGSIIGILESLGHASLSHKFAAALAPACREMLLSP